MAFLPTFDFDLDHLRALDTFNFDAIEVYEDSDDDVVESDAVSRESAVPSTSSGDVSVPSTSSAYVGSLPAVSVPDVQAPVESVASGAGSASKSSLVCAGFRSAPAPDLVTAAEGEAKQSSYRNNGWALKRAEALRAHLHMDQSVALGDLPFAELDKFLVLFFQSIVKIKDGSLYPSSSIMNFVNSFNRLIRHASDKRAVKGQAHIADSKSFNLLCDPSFVATRLVVEAAIRKSQEEGANKPVQKVDHLTKQMELAILADADHQTTSPHGCQKRLAFYLLVRFGIRGGTELYNLERNDIQVYVNDSGKHCLVFDERLTKNNKVTLKRYNVEQMRRQYHTYEGDFVFTFRQYLRKLPVMEEGVKSALFLSPIANPRTEIWYSKSQRASVGTVRNWLKVMLRTVGLEPSQYSFSNRSGRATLITRLASSGVPDHVGMLLSGHRTADGYGRYDRTKELAMEAGALVASGEFNGDYKQALAHVSRHFVQKRLKGDDSLNPLLPVKVPACENAVLCDVTNMVKSGSVTAGAQLAVVPPVFVEPKSVVASILTDNLPTAAVGEILTTSVGEMATAVGASSSNLEKEQYLGSKFFDNLDWDNIVLDRDPEKFKERLVRALNQQPSVDNSSFHMGTNNSHCTFHITINKL